VRQHDRAADHLVGVLRVDPQAQRDLDRFVELRELHLLHEGNRVLERVRTIGDLLPGGRKLLACFAHG
jgi:hypothetical protein